MTDDAATLDGEILAAVAAWYHDGTVIDDATFNALALRIFRYQLATNEPYRRYANALGVIEPRDWRGIPAVPAAAFKETAMCTFPPERAALRFETSGTTQGGRSGHHFFENAALYEAACEAAFARLFLGMRTGLRFFNLVPDPGQRPQSSLGHMMRHVAKRFGVDAARWYLDGDRLLLEDFSNDLERAIEQGTRVCIAGTAFAFVHLLDALGAHDRRFRLPTGSVVMETGGFKGRTREVARGELYGTLADRLGVATSAIVAEYGMTELASQYYDRADSPVIEPRIKVAPPWLRTRVVDPYGVDLEPGAVGLLTHVDLANRSSVVAVATEDWGYAAEGGIVLIGRATSSDPRGCSLDAETLCSAP